MLFSSWKSYSHAKLVILCQRRFCTTLVADRKFKPKWILSQMTAKIKADFAGFFYFHLTNFS
jgi:hypothetical protein